MDRTLSSKSYSRKDIPLPRGRLPAPHAAHVHVNEAGARIISDAAAAQRQGGVPKVSRRNTGQANINGFSFHVQALLCHTGSVGSQILVAPARSITTDDANFAIRTAGGASQIRK